MLKVCEAEAIEEKNDNGGNDDDGHFAILSNLDRSSGSAMYTFGDNIVQCSLYGPNPISQNLTLLKKNYFHVFLYPLGQIKNAMKDKSLIYYEYFLKRTFTPMIYPSLPRSKTHVVINEIEKGSSFLSTCLNAFMLTLIDSGYPLQYCIGTSGFILDRRDNQLYSEREFKEKFSKSKFVMEPVTFTLDNCDFIKATFCFSNKNTNLKTTSLLAEGKFSLNDVLQAKQKSNDSIASFFHFARKKVSERFV